MSNSDHISHGKMTSSSSMNMPRNTRQSGSLRSTSESRSRVSSLPLHPLFAPPSRIFHPLPLPYSTDLYNNVVRHSCGDDENDGMTSLLQCLDKVELILQVNDLSSYVPHGQRVDDNGISPEATIQLPVKKNGKEHTKTNKQ